MDKGARTTAMLAEALRSIQMSGGLNLSSSSNNLGTQVSGSGRAMAEFPLTDEITLSGGASGYLANVPTSQGRETFSGYRPAPVELSHRGKNREEQFTIDPITGDVMINVGWPDVQSGRRPPSGELWDLHNVPRIK